MEKRNQNKVFIDKNKIPDNKLLLSRNVIAIYPV